MATSNNRFRHIQTYTPDYSTNRISQYESTDSGIQLVWVKTESLIVDGNIGFATEIHNNSGVPHTLEHLCFTGSKAHPYKGILDKAASHFMGKTNAWTDTDCTNYTFQSPGPDGVLSLLPMYLDHVVRPTLSEDSFTTEVHHITGEGTNAGVVYCEMQNHEFDMTSMMDLVTRSLIYPDGHGLRSETGGQLAPLRVLTIDQIRKYHKEIYLPRNIRIVLSGKVDIEAVLTVVEKFEDSIRGEISFDPSFKRPWIGVPGAKIPKSIIYPLEYPSSEEKTACISVSTAGPEHHEFVNREALDVLKIYLSETPASPLSKFLVQEEHLAGDVHIYNLSRISNTIEIMLSGVKVDSTKMLDSAKKVATRLSDLIKEVINGPLDMPFMLTCMNQNLRMRKLSAEQYPNEDPINSILQDHLYEPRDGKNLKAAHFLDDIHKQLAEWTEKQWKSAISEWFASPSVTVIGIPSIALAEKNRVVEEARIKAQQDKLGETGLAKKAEELKQAMDKNDAPLPDGALKLGPVDVDAIKVIPTTPARSGSAIQGGRVHNKIQELVDADAVGALTRNNLAIYFEEYSASFVSISVNLDTSSLPTSLKPLIALYADTFFGLPRKEADGSVTPYDEVAKSLEDRLLVYGVSKFSDRLDQLSIFITVERERYSEAIRILKTMMFDSVIDPARLKSSIKSIISSIPDDKQSGNIMLSEVQGLVLENTVSASRSQSVLVKSKYYSDLRRLLKQNPAAVIAGVEEVRKLLHAPENMRIFVGGEVSQLERPVASWDQITSASSNPKELNPLASQIAALSPAGTFKTPTAVLLPLKACDSSFGRLFGPCPDSFSHKDGPAFRVALEVLNVTEGPMWVGLRGAGLVYSARVYPRQRFNQVMLNIYRSSNPSGAIAKSQKIILDIVNGVIPISDTDLENGRKAVVQSIAKSCSLPSNTATVLFSQDVLLRDSGYSRTTNDDLREGIKTVTKEQTLAAIKNWVLPLFDPAVATMVLTGPSGSAETTAATIKKELKFDVIVKTIKEFEDENASLYQFKPEIERVVDADDSDASDEDEDDDEDEHEHSKGCCGGH